MMMKLKKGTFGLMILKKQLSLPGDKLIVDGQRQTSSDVVSIDKNLYITGMSDAALGVDTLIVGGGALVYVEALELVGNWQVDPGNSILWMQDCCMSNSITVETGANLYLHQCTFMSNDRVNYPSVKVDVCAGLVRIIGCTFDHYHQKKLPRIAIDMDVDDDSIDPYASHVTLRCIGNIFKDNKSPPFGLRNDYLCEVSLDDEMVILAHNHHDS